MSEHQTAFGLLLLRVIGGGALAYSRILHLLAGLTFAPGVAAVTAGLGPQFQLGGVLFSEVVCPIFVVLGIGVQVTSLPPLVAMLVPLLMLPAGVAWSEREIYLMRALPFLVLSFTGAGVYSFDARFVSRRRPR